MLPLEAIESLGVPDAAKLSRRLLGAYPFAKVEAGMSPQDWAIYTTLQRASEGDVSATEATATSDAVGGGPVPSFAKTVESEGGGGEGGGGDGGDDGDDDGDLHTELLLIKFDPKPGAQVWQVAGVQLKQKPSTGGATGVVYLRGKPPSVTASNSLDIASVVAWEVAVGIAGEGDAPRTTRWVPAPNLRATRGAEGERLWAAEHAEPTAKKKQKMKHASKEEL